MSGLCCVARDIICRVELHAGKIGVYIQLKAGDGGEDLCHFPRLALVHGKDKVVVITVTEAQLFIICVDISSNGLPIPEIKGRSAYIKKSACRNGSGVNFSNFI